MKGNNHRLEKTQKQYKYLGLITALYITFQLVSDVTDGKIVYLWYFTVSASVLYSLLRIFLQTS